MQQFNPDIPSSTGEALKLYMQTGGWMTENKRTKEFENMIKEFLNVKHCFAVTSGTTALYAALKACGVGHGDSVLVPAFTMIATANAVRMTGARPIFVDIDPKTLCMDTKLACNMMELHDVKAIIYVAFNGRCGSIIPLTEIAHNYGVHLIEDACQAFGSKHVEKYIGTYGDIGCYSLSPYKTITTGQGGLVVTNDDELAGCIKNIKDHGKVGPDQHDYFGVNFKFTDLQATVGIEQMKEIKKRIKKKKAVYNNFIKKFRSITNIKLVKTKTTFTLPWMIDIYVEDRDDLIEFLKHRGVQTRKMYPPIYKQKCYNDDISLPVTEEFSSTGMWLPSSPNILNEEINELYYSLRRYYG